MIIWHSHRVGDLFTLQIIVDGELHVIYTTGSYNFGPVDIIMDSDNIPIIVKLGYTSQGRF